MNYIDKNLIIERYINGAMTPDEVQSFHTLLETDSELRSLFQAENMIKSTMAKERYALEAINHSHSYAVFLQGLANSVPQTAAATSAAGAGKAASWLSGISTSVKVAVSAAVVTGTVLVGTLVMQPTSQQDNALPMRNVQKQPTKSTPAQHHVGSSQNTTSENIGGKQESTRPVLVPTEKVGSNTVAQKKQQAQASERSISTESAPVQQAQHNTGKMQQKNEEIPSFNDSGLNINVQADSNANTHKK